MRHRSLPWLFLIAPLCTDSAEIGTAGIVRQTADATLACLRWTPVGMCFWLDCSLAGCRVESSLKVGHYNPDVVVSSYNELGQNPWRETRAALGAAQTAAANGVLGRLGNVVIESAGNRTEGSPERRDHKNLVFREADVIGHPLQLLPTELTPLLCASQAEPLAPYFLSALDAVSWRNPLIEMLYPASLIPGLREVGDWPLNTWGSVHPRGGWSVQAEEPKAAALTAQRAADIVTRPSQPHVYQPLPGPDVVNQQVWPPDALIENDARTGTWQMLAPLPESTCAEFGINDLDTVAGWGGGRVDESGDYVWNLWRPYRCCQRQGQIFLFDIDWVDFP